MRQRLDNHNVNDKNNAVNILIDLVAYGVTPIGLVLTYLINLTPEALLSPV